MRAIAIRAVSLSSVVRMVIGNAAPMPLPWTPQNGVKPRVSQRGKRQLTRIVTHESDQKRHVPQVGGMTGECGCKDCEAGQGMSPRRASRRRQPPSTPGPGQARRSHARPDTLQAQDSSTPQAEDTRAQGREGTETQYETRYIRAGPVWSGLVRWAPWTRYIRSGPCRTVPTLYEA